MYLKSVDAWLLWALFLPLTKASYSVKLESDSPAVLDAPIVFTGRLLGQHPEVKAMFRWRFSDDASPGHFNESDSDSSVTERKYTLVYPSHTYQSGTYEMTLTIYEYFGYFYWKEVGRNKVRFRITSELNGKLDVTQDGIKTEIVSTAKEAQMDVKFHDPSSYLDHATIHYFWFINTLNYGQTVKGEFKYNFTTPGYYNVEVTTIAYFNNTQDAIHVDNLLEGNDWNAVKLGIFQKALVAKMPITGTNVTGDVVLKHGQLVDLNVACDGTGDWSYCWSIKDKGYNITGNETCSSPQYLKTECDFSIIWYFKNCGIYDILVEISNDVSSYIEVIPVTVKGVANIVNMILRK